jgi:hypothetical protein
MRENRPASRRTAENLFAEVGAALSRFPSDNSQVCGARRTLLLEIHGIGPVIAARIIGPTEPITLLQRRLLRRVFLEQLGVSEPGGV